MSSDGISVLQAIKSKGRIFELGLSKMIVSMGAHTPQYADTFMRRKHTHTTHLQFQNGAPPAKSLVFIVIIIVRVSYAIIITTMIFVRSASKRLGAIMISFPASFSTAPFFHNSSLFSCYALAQVVNLILSPSKISLWMLVFSNTTIANGIDLDCGHTETCTLKKFLPFSDVFLPIQKHISFFFTVRLVVMATCFLFPGEMIRFLTFKLAIITSDSVYSTVS